VELDQGQQTNYEELFQRGWLFAAKCLSFDGKSLLAAGIFTIWTTKHILNHF
jgi:hypothetical protein